MEFNSKINSATITAGQLKTIAVLRNKRYLTDNYILRRFIQPIVTALLVIRFYSVLSSRQHDTKAAESARKICPRVNTRITDKNLDWIQKELLQFMPLNLFNTTSIPCF